VELVIVAVTFGQAIIKRTQVLMEKIYAGDINQHYKFIDGLQPRRSGDLSTRKDVE